MYCSKLCILLFIVICIAVLVIVMLIICLVIFPSFAQNCADRATIELMAGTVYDPTNDSIQLNATMKLENNGMFDADLHGAHVDVYNDGFKIGNMLMPSIHIIGGQTTIVNISSKINITNITQFQISCRRNLQGQNEIWQLSSSPKLKMQMGHLPLHTHVTLNKNLLMQGSTIENFQATNITIIDATNDTLSVLCDVSFRLSSNGMQTYVLPPQTFTIYINNTQIGYSPMPHMILLPNVINYFNRISFVIQVTNHSRQIVEHFFSLYTMGIPQQVQFTGPDNSHKLVINNIINQRVTVGSSISSPLAFGSILTKETMNGWRVKLNGSNKIQTIRGAYANMQNPFNVDIKIIDLKAKSYFYNSIRYNVTLLKWFSKITTFQCYPNKTNEYALLSTGYGMFKSNFSKTFVQIPPNSKATYFVIANPLSELDTQESCFGILPFSCCYITLTTAYICSQNPQLKFSNENELTLSYIPTKLEANITVLINDKFQIKTNYIQDFMPVYFGYEIYSGFIGDLELNCKDFTFY